MSVKCLDLSGFSYFWSQFKESDYWKKLNANDTSATLTTSWTGASAPYTQNVVVSGLLAADPIDVGLADAASGTEYEAAAKAQLHCTSQTAGQITVTAFGEKPTIALPIVVRVFTNETATPPSPEPVPRKDVNFIDYDGTVLYAYTVAEAQALSALPASPSHDGLTFQEWNFTLAEVNSLTHKRDVGATYITDDGKTRLYINLPRAGLEIPLVFSQSVSEGVTVDWGDGSDTETFEGTWDIRPMHQYTIDNQCVITFDVSSGCELRLGNGYDIVVGASVIVLSGLLTRVEIGNGVTNIMEYGLSYCSNLTSITIPNTVPSIEANGLYECSDLTSIVIPNGITSIADGIFCGCYNLNSISLPNSVTSIGGYALNVCGCPVAIAIPNGVTSIGTEAFGGCALLKELHCLPTSPPTFGADMLNGTSTDLTIYVPTASLASYQAADGWSDYAGQMVGE